MNGSWDLLGVVTTFFYFRPSKARLRETVGPSLPHISSASDYFTTPILCALNDWRALSNPALPEVLFIAMYD